MDCVSNKSKKKIQGLRAPRARGKRASFHGCSSLEEPPTLDPKVRKLLVKSKTESDLDVKIIPPLKLDHFKENVTPKTVKVHLETIGESSTDDILVDDDKHVDNIRVDDVDTVELGEDEVDTGIVIVKKSIEPVDNTEDSLVDVEELAVIDDSVDDKDSKIKTEINEASTKTEATDIEKETLDSETDKEIESQKIVTEIGDEIENEKQDVEKEITNEEPLASDNTENVSNVVKEELVKSCNQLIENTEEITGPGVGLDDSEECFEKSNNKEKIIDLDESIQDKLEEVKDQSVETDEIAFINETVIIKDDSEKVTFDLDRTDHSDKELDIDHSSEDKEDLGEKKFVIEEEMDLPVVKQSHVDPDKTKPELKDEHNESSVEKGGSVLKDSDKEHIKSGTSFKGLSKDERMFKVFSEHVDQDSIMEDVKDDATVDDDIEVGIEVLVLYMKRHHHKQLKTSLRNNEWGITNEVRSSLWFNLCHYLHKAGDTDMFSEFAEDLFTPGDYTDVGIPSFVDMNHLNSYHLSVDGIYTSKQILCVLGHSNPDVIYSPILYSILTLFLHYMDTSQCYNCLYSLLRHKDSSFLPTTKVSYEASKLVMRDLAKKHAKSGYVYLSRNCSDIDEVFDTWIWWIFEDLPLIFIVRIIDCYLQEGIKIFYRVCLAIITLFAKTHAKKSSPKNSPSGGNILTALRQFCCEIPVPVHKLLKTSFSIKGLSRKEIRKLQVKHEMYINSTKLIQSNDTQQKSGQLPISRSFSGPMILQNLGSNTLNADSLYALLTWLPTRYAICQPELLYTSEEHGTSLVTLYQRVENHQPTVIIIKTTEDEVFGAFCSTRWSERRQKSHLLSYFGTGETFLFTLAPEKKKYDWVGLNNENIPNTASMFQAGDRSILTIGGGHGEAISLDEMMLHCRSERCDTFNNEPLSQSEDFVCRVVEVYGF